MSIYQVKDPTSGKPIRDLLQEIRDRKSHSFDSVKGCYVTIDYRITDSDKAEAARLARIDQRRVNLNSALHAYRFTDQAEKQDMIEYVKRIVNFI